MKKYIFILNAIELLKLLLDGKYIQGVLYMDQNTGRPRNREKDVLVKKLPWGWVKESMTRKKRYSSIPKDLTLKEQLAILDEENELAKQALIESYIIESV